MSYKKNDVCILERPYNLRPKELLQSNGSQGLSDYDLIALIIGGTTNKSLHEVCCKIVSLLSIHTDEITIKMIQDETGITSSKAASIIAALELGRRKTDKSMKTIMGPESIYVNVLHWANEEQEHFIVGNVNGAHEITDINVATVGLLNKTLVHPREVFRRAVEQRSAGIFIAHNHPSGCLYPSAEDMRITKRLVLSSDIIGIPILDHLIFTSQGFFSFQKEKLLNQIRDYEF